ncbi:MAG TPA: ABC transporter permease [Ardenticatenaceae bacterium]|jgi:osmoprotectant transport system permease protein
MQYLLRNPERVWMLFLEHLRLTGTTLLIALVLALPIALFITRQKRLQGPVLGLLSILYTIPSLALFVLLIPPFGLGFRNAVVALVIYAQVILVRNIVAGLESVPSSVIEAARGMGMNSWQIFYKIELPLALPVILAGLRVATLSTVGIGTIAAYVGAGGLGRLLFDGVQQGRPDRIVAGAIAVSVLAIAINTLLRFLETRATQAMHLER